MADLCYKSQIEWYAFILMNINQQDPRWYLECTVHRRLYHQRLSRTMYNSFNLLMLCFPFRQIISPLCDNKGLQSDNFDKPDMLLKMPCSQIKTHGLLCWVFSQPGLEKEHIFPSAPGYFMQNLDVGICMILKRTVQ